MLDKMTSILYIRLGHLYEPCSHLSLALYQTGFPLGNGRSRLGSRGRMAPCPRLTPARAPPADALAAYPCNVFLVGSAADDPEG